MCCSAAVRQGLAEVAFEDKGDAVFLVDVLPLHPAIGTHREL
eukprot:CAMPEP_0181219456 /NCGR_PEP_ID=MMETSP1096-20121128/28286_1 /TAXON_ID=156174 ORGANISM="Chrysochromulina ericina, Strain CCMP281" /NCGR_SAMPLE_ID=MMETSP1096 /ASSEMBLY_ACC=CAM_ASM_000453 /LENGTH=41 /DNA_ID= /DNA_START= /DNA_END= /DNA_ORIENTATION=